MAALFTVEIVTPESSLFSGEATALMARSSEGEFTILAHHTPMVGDLVAGLVRVGTDEGELSFVVHGGFFQVDTDASKVTRATVLAGVAEPASAVDVTRATAAKERAEAVLSGRSDAEEDDAQVAARSSLARAELRLALAR